MRQKNPTIYEILGKNIEQIRQKQNMTLAQLSEKSGIRKEYLKRIEAGKARRFGALEIFRIAKALNVLLEDLVGNL